MPTYILKISDYKYFKINIHSSFKLRQMSIFYPGTQTFLPSFTPSHYGVNHYNC